MTMFYLPFIIVIRCYRALLAQCNGCKKKEAHIRLVVCQLCSIVYFGFSNFLHLNQFAVWMMPRKNQNFYNKIWRIFRSIVPTAKPIAQLLFLQRLVFKPFESMGKKSFEGETLTRTIKKKHFNSITENEVKPSTLKYIWWKKRISKLDYDLKDTKLMYESDINQKSGFLSGIHLFIHKMNHIWTKWISF